MQTAHDIPLQVTSENSGSERRITPSWSIAQLKTKLEPVTGVPPSAQKLSLRLPNQPEIALEAADEENMQLARFPLQAYAEIHVCICLTRGLGGALCSTKTFEQHHDFLFPVSRVTDTSLSLLLST